MHNVDSNLNTKRISANALLAAISLLLSIFARPIAVPFIPFLKIDFVDVPIFASTLLFGMSSGSVILFSVSFIKTLFFSIAGWTGFVMRMTSIVIVFFLGIYYKKQKYFLILCTISILISILIKSPISYIFWVYFHSTPAEIIKSRMLPIIIPLNVIKMIINITFASILTKRLKKILELN